MVNSISLLFTPGPTKIPEQVQAEISKPMIHHRSDEFEKIFSSLRNNLNQISKTDGESVVLTSSGTAAMEAVIVSMFSKNEHVIVVDAGKFGERWATIAQHHGLQVTVVEKSWGQSVKVDEVMSQVKPSTKAVFIQGCESSTGVHHPIVELGDALKHFPHVLFVVDAITTFGIYPFNQRLHHIDVMVAASQKGLMCPPGLSLVCMSQKALSKLRPSPVLYLSLEHELKSQIHGGPAFTPAISLVRGMEKSTQMILDEGIEKVFERHSKLQKITRDFFRSHGFKHFANDQDASMGITAVYGIPKLDIEKWLGKLRTDYGLWLASAQGDYKGKFFRMAHMGYCYEKDLREALQIIAQSLE